MLMKATYILVQVLYLLDLSNKASLIQCLIFIYFNILRVAKWMKGQIMIVVFEASMKEQQCKTIQIQLPSNAKVQ